MKFVIKVEKGFISHFILEAKSEEEAQEILDRMSDSELKTKVSDESPEHSYLHANIVEESE